MNEPAAKEPVVDFDSVQSLSSWALVLRGIVASNKDKLSSHDTFWLEQCINDLWRLCDRIPSAKAVEDFAEKVRAVRLERGLDVANAPMVHADIGE